jgi:hypothetical protein
VKGVSPRDVRILVQMVDAVRVKGARAPDNPVDLVPLLQQISRPDKIRRGRLPVISALFIKEWILEPRGARERIQNSTRWTFRVCRRRRFKRLSRAKDARLAA